MRKRQLPKAISRTSRRLASASTAARAWTWEMQPRQQFGRRRGPGEARRHYQRRSYSLCRQTVALNRTIGINRIASHTGDKTQAISGGGFEHAQRLQYWEQRPSLAVVSSAQVGIEGDNFSCGGLKHRQQSAVPLLQTRPQHQIVRERAASSRTSRAADGT